MYQRKQKKTNKRSSAVMERGCHFTRQPSFPHSRHLQSLLTLPCAVPSLSLLQIPPETADMLISSENQADRDTGKSYHKEQERRPGAFPGSEQPRRHGIRKVSRH